LPDVSSTLACSRLDGAVCWHARVQGSFVRVTDERVIPSSSGSLESVVTMTSTTTTKPVATKPIAPQLAEAHKHASQHRVEIEASTCCGCFFCFRTFPPLSIKAWIDARQTALCPGCGVDSVLGNASSHRIDDAFLRRMHGQFFVRRSK
jgi:hypothetical protein